ncbi:MAG: glycosyltransferase [Elusimicrobia bacterium]|nr:glycosyltransferase [Candidatus Liberimonas magnetica]
MNPKNNIVFLVPGFPQNEDDTACIPALQNYVLYYAKQFPDSKITIISFQYPFNKRAYKWNGIEVYSMGRKNRKLLRLFDWLKVIYFFTRLHSAGNFRIIHSFWLGECSFIGQILSFIFNIPQVASIMGQDAKPGNHYLRLLKYSRLTVTTPSANASRFFREATGKNVNTVIPFGLDREQVPINDRNTKREIDVLGAGSLIPVKNYSLFLEIISVLAKEFPELKAVLIGDGVEKEYLEQKIDGLGLHSNVTLTGSLPRREVFKYMQQSKVFLHTSIYEGQGYVFMEALYCGLHVVCFNVGHTPPNKKICICTDKKEMIAKIKELLLLSNDYEPILLKSMNETVKDFNNIYRSLTGR